jgi:hypothetical protein
MKSEVYRFYLKVPESILKAIRWIIWKRKTDEDQLGASYDD